MTLDQKHYLILDRISQSPSPTLRELCILTKLSIGGIQDRVAKLEQAAYITRSFGRHRAMELTGKGIQELELERGRIK